MNHFYYLKLTSLFNLILLQAAIYGDIAPCKIWLVNYHPSPLRNPKYATGERDRALLKFVTSR